MKITNHAKERMLERSNLGTHKQKQVNKLILEIDKLNNQITNIHLRFDQSAENLINKIIEKGRLVKPKYSLRVLLEHLEPTTYYHWQKYIVVVIKNEIVKTVMEYERKKWKEI